VNILMVTAEMAPFAKVGGLADVAEALSRTLARRKHDVRVVVPLYGSLDRKALKITRIKQLPTLPVRVGQTTHDVRLFRLGAANAAVKIYLVGAELFDRKGIYTDAQGEGWPDALERASLHTQVALMLPRLLDWPVDIIHAHDAASAPALVMRRQWYTGRELPGPAGTVLTIHNLAHQEVYPPGAADTLGLPPALAAYPGLLEFHGQMNLMKGGILAADRVNTVSPTYAEETRTDPAYGCGLQNVLAEQEDRYSGILNGGDYETWDPQRDTMLPARFSSGDLKGKKACRQALVKKAGLKVAADRPLCGFVGRLVGQKGVDILVPVLDRLADDGFGFVILGTGEKRLENDMHQVAKRWPDQVAFIDAFDEKLAHLIYAGSDLFLMPSLFEPCGLSQMYALRYGTPPVVRRTGGLADTVIDATDKAGTGFVFDEGRPEALLGAMRTAERLFAQPAQWLALQKRGMALDFSWDTAAPHYEELYNQALAAAAARVRS
jgi:starch synthase